MRNTKGPTEVDQPAKAILKEWLERWEGNQKYEGSCKPRRERFTTDKVVAICCGEWKYEKGRNISSGFSDKETLVRSGG